MKRGFLLSLTLWLLAASVAQAEETSFNLMLTGSELQFCRSTMLKQCNPESVTKFSKDFTRQSKRFKLSMVQIEKAMSAELWHSSRQVLRFELNIFLTEFAKKVGTSMMSYEQLVNRWKTSIMTQGKSKYSGHSLFLRLTKNEHDMVFDFLEVAQLDSFGRTLKERIVVEDTKNPSSISQAKLIIEQARLVNNNPRPIILLVTAGNRDTFADVDAYQEFFTSLGATTKWLPIDRALNTLHIDKVSCSVLDKYRGKFQNSFQRGGTHHEKVALQRQYCENPEKIEQDLSRADGLVFIGDSPKLLRDSFIIHERIISNPLRLIKQHINQGKLFVAALGAVSRAMVGHENKQPVIISGRSKNVMAFGTTKAALVSTYCQRGEICKPKATIFSEGGIGLFDFSIVDTQFSKRGHFARLANVAMDTNQRFAIGIDEDTALLIAKNKSTLTIRVAGLAGATLLQKQLNTPVSPTHELDDIKVSYFTTGDTLNITGETIKVDYPKWKPSVTSFLNQPQDYGNLLFSDNFYRFAQQACLIEDSQWKGFAGRKRGYSVLLEKSEQTQLKMGGLKVDSGFKLYCSFHALNLNLNQR